MSDAEVIELAKQAFQFGQKMRTAIADNDNEERKSIRTEWEIFRGENSKHHASLILSYHNGLENVTTNT